MNIFYVIKTYVGLTFEPTSVSCEIALSFPSLSTNPLQHVFIVEITNSF